MGANCVVYRRWHNMACDRRYIASPTLRADRVAGERSSVILDLTVTLHWAPMPNKLALPKQAAGFAAKDGKAWQIQVKGVDGRAHRMKRSLCVRFSVGRTVGSLRRDRGVPTVVEANQTSLYGDRLR